MTVIALLTLLITPCWASPFGISSSLLSLDVLPNLDTLNELSGPCSTQANELNAIMNGFFSGPCAVLDDDDRSELCTTCVPEVSSMLQAISEFSDSCTYDDLGAMDPMFVIFIVGAPDVDEFNYNMSVQCTQNPDGIYCMDIINGLRDSSTPPACGDIPQLLGCCAGTAYLEDCGIGVQDLGCEMSVWQEFCECSPEVCMAEYVDMDNHESCTQNPDVSASPSGTPKASSTSAASVSAAPSVAASVSSSPVAASPSGNPKASSTSAASVSASSSPDVCLAIDLTNMISPYSGSTADSPFTDGCRNFRWYYSPPAAVLFKYLLPVNETITLDSLNDFDSYSEDLFGGSCPGMNEIACFEFEDNYRWTNTGPTPEWVYYVLKGQFADSRDSGDFVLAWSLGGALPNFFPSSASVSAAPSLSDEDYVSKSAVRSFSLFLVTTFLANALYLVQ